MRRIPVYFAPDTGRRVGATPLRRVAAWVAVLVTTASVAIAMLLPSVAHAAVNCAPCG
ncbi:MAG: hypothetical protein ACRDZ4_08785 [Egibacteraceae bacterium]